MLILFNFFHKLRALAGTPGEYSKYLRKHREQTAYYWLLTTSRDFVITERRAHSLCSRPEYESRKKSRIPGSDLCIRRPSRLARSLVSLLTGLCNYRLWSGCIDTQRNARARLLSFTREACRVNINAVYPTFMCYSSFMYARRTKNI